MMCSKFTGKLPPIYDMEKWENDVLSGFRIIFQTWVEDTNPTKLHGGPHEELVVRRGDCIHPRRNLVSNETFFATGLWIKNGVPTTLKSMGPWASSPHGWKVCNCCWVSTHLWFFSSSISL
jgi:hypothetical protein